MINEKMIEYLVLADILDMAVDLSEQESEILVARYTGLRDEFINEQMAYKSLIKNPVKDTTNSE